MSSFTPAYSQCEKAALMGSCSHFALLWILTPSAAVMGMDGRKMQFCSLIFHWVVITESHPDRTTVRPVDLVSLNSLLKPVLPRTREPDGKAPLLYSASLSCGQGFSFEIQVYSTNKPHKLIVLRSLTCVAFILVHSTFFTWC